MDNYYAILSKVLNTEYHLSAIISILDTLEASYRQEDQFELKALATVIKGYLCGLEGDIKDLIEFIDTLTAQKQMSEQLVMNQRSQFI